MFLLITPIKVSADETVSQNLDNFVILDDVTLYNMEEDSYYLFATNENLYEFLVVISGNDNVSTYACLPGDPGYPNCNGDAVVKVETKTIKTTTTGYVLSDNWLLGNNGWIYGPGTCGLTIGRTYGATFGITQDGITGSFNHSVTVNQSYSYSVVAGKKGNFKYTCKLRIETKQYIYTLESGKKSTGPFYLVTKMIDGTGGFKGISVKI